MKRLQLINKSFKKNEWNDSNHTHKTKPSESIPSEPIDNINPRKRAQPHPNQ